MKQLDLKVYSKIGGNISRPDNKDLFSKYLSDLNKYHVLTREEEHELFNKVKEYQCSKSIDILCKHNLRFVVSVAKTYSSVINNTFMTLEDLICEGNIGLINAIHKFDHNSENKFISYAIWHIRQMMYKYINEHSKSIRTPQNVRILLNKINRYKSKLYNELQREPSLEELYDYCKLNMKEVDKLTNFDNFCYVLDHDRYDKLLSSTINDDLDSSTIGDTLVCSESDSILNNIFKLENKSELYKMLDKLSYRNKDIISMYYGINIEKCALKLIAEKYEISKGAIKNIIIKIIKELKIKNINNNPFKDLIDDDYEYKIIVEKEKRKQIQTATLNKYGTIYDDTNTIYLI